PLVTDIHLAVRDQRRAEDPVSRVVGPVLVAGARFQAVDPAPLVRGDDQAVVHSHGGNRGVHPILFLVPLFLKAPDGSRVGVWLPLLRAVVQFWADVALLRGVDAPEPARD